MSLILTLWVCALYPHISVFWKAERGTSFSPLTDLLHHFEMLMTFIEHNPEKIAVGFWFAKFLPKASAQYAKRYFQNADTVIFN